MTCITPRAFADDTMPLLKPLSCQAIAEASEPGTPCCEAIWPISDDVACPGVAYGAACGTACGGPLTVVAAGAPDGSFSAVPDSSGAAGSRPFIQASSFALTPERAAMPLRVSPGWTVWPPVGGGAPPPVEAGAAAVVAPAAGIWIVLPRITFESELNPLAAASAEAL